MSPASQAGRLPSTSASHPSCGLLAAGLLLCLLAAPVLATDYYVNNAGDDDNAGTSPEGPWRTLDKVNTFPLKPGDVVHFRCAGTWRGQLVPHSGSPQGYVTYTSYGTGPKPLLLGSVEKNDPRHWQAVGPNLWQTGPFPVDVGNIIFDDGRSCGVKVWNRSDVNRPLRFWYDAAHKSVLLYLEKNPARQFRDIECALKRHIINEGGRSYVVYDGLHLAYGAAHGIGGGGTHHIVVRNCDLCFIGGGHQFSRKTARGIRHVRYGNGVEFWDGAHDNLVEGCHIWDIYDAGLTNQGSGRNQQYNITYRNNVIWNCEYSFEYWNRPNESVTHDIYFEDNVCYNAGHGWSHAQRPWPAGVHLMFFNNSARTSRFFVRRNLFHNAEDSYLNIRVPSWNGLDGLVLDENTFCQPPGKVLVHWGGRSFTADQFLTYQQATGKDANSQIVTLARLTVSPRQLSLRVGGAGRLRVAAVYSNGRRVEATGLCEFAVADTGVVAVDRGGRVRGLRAGSSSVRVGFGGLQALVGVEVQATDGGVP